MFGNASVAAEVDEVVKEQASSEGEPVPAGEDSDTATAQTEQLHRQHRFDPCRAALAELRDATKAVDVLAGVARDPGYIDRPQRDRPEVEAAIERLREANVEWRKAVAREGC